MQERNVRYSYREFLNHPGFHGAGFIVADVVHRVDDDCGDDWTDARLTIADCDRRINMSIDLGDAEIDNTLYKLDVMLEGLKGLRREVAKIARSRRR